MNRYDIQDKNPEKSAGTTQYLAGIELFTWKESACQEYKNEHTHGVKNGSASTITMGETDIEKCVVEGCVDEGKDKDKCPTTFLFYTEISFCETSDNEQNES